MTRLLSELLSAQEPFFRNSLTRLERAHGNPSHDIRLSSEVARSTRDKLKQLGLDPDDTTGPELYHALQQRLHADDKKLEKTLRTLAATHVSAEGDVVSGMVQALKELPMQRSCYALKQSVLKSLLKQLPPKKAMKNLGYRSVESLLKNESPAHVLAAATLVESAAWHHNLLDSYSRLTPRDFEVRQISITTPGGKRWSKLAGQAVAKHRHSLLSFKELGAVVVLPLPDDKPAGSTTAVVALVLHALNDIRAVSSCLQLAQVRGDFGKLVQQVTLDEAQLDSSVLDQPVPWQLAHRYYARLKRVVHDELFEGSLDIAELGWHSVEDALSLIEPGMAFWRGTGHLGHSPGHQAVSLNLLDNALSFCNQLPFQERVSSYGHGALSGELMLRYLKPEAIETAVKTTMQPQLAEEAVLL